jgi:hypothetical protein
LHAVLGNTRLSGEWFKDADESLIGRVSAYMDAQGFAEYRLSAPEDIQEKRAVDKLSQQERAVTCCATLRAKYPDTFKDAQNALSQSVTTPLGATVTVRIFPRASSFDVGVMRYGNFVADEAMRAFVESTGSSVQINYTKSAPLLNIAADEEAVSTFKALVAFLESNEDF